jgi:hypothetical protein
MLKFKAFAQRVAGGQKNPALRQPFPPGYPQMLWMVVTSPCNINVIILSYSIAACGRARTALHQPSALV